MVLVGEQQLKRVPSTADVRLLPFGLRRMMRVIEVIRNGLVERRQLGVDQKMMVAGIGLFHAGGRHDRRIAFCGRIDPSCKPTQYTRASAGAGSRGGRPCGTIATGPSTRGNRFSKVARGVE